MDRTVREHITALHERLNALSAQLMEEADREKRNALEAEIRAANLALGYFNAALESEKKLEIS